MATTRTFLGIDVGPSIRTAAAEMQRTLAKQAEGIRWTPAEMMHITLLFLGELNDQELVTVCRTTTKIAASEPEFSLSVRGLGAFPNLRRPKILWGGVVDESGVLLRLQNQLEAQLIEKIGYRPEERGYTPHLTLGRLQSDPGLSQIVARYADWEAGSVRVTELGVYRSDLRRDGPEYSVIARGMLHDGEPIGDD